MTDAREQYGRVVRDTWVAWAKEQSDPKPSWLTGWDELDPGQREVDMRIAEAVIRAYFPRVITIEETDRLIADLQAFEREYRARLKAYHESRIRELDGENVPDEEAH